MHTLTKLLLSFACLAAIPGMVLAGETSSAAERLNKRREAREARYPHFLVNPGFEDAGANRPLASWIPLMHSGDHYRIDRDSGQSVGGKHSLVIENIGMPSWGGAAQTIRAGDFAGRDMELKAQVRLQRVTAPGFYIIVRVKNTGREIAAVKTDQKMTGDSDWKEVSLRGPIPAEATHLEVMLMLQGDGAAWVDEVSLTSQ